MSSAAFMHPPSRGIPVQTPARVAPDRRGPSCPPDEGLAASVPESARLEEAGRPSSCRSRTALFPCPGRAVARGLQGTSAGISSGSGDQPIRFFGVVAGQVLSGGLARVELEAVVEGLEADTQHLRGLSLVAAVVLERGEN